MRWFWFRPRVIDVPPARYYPVPEPQFERQPEPEPQYHIDGGDSDDEPTAFRLPSREGLDFDMSAVVRYRMETDVPSDADPFPLAVAAIRRRAEEISVKFSLSDSDRLWSELESSLRTRGVTEIPGLCAWARDIGLSADETDAATVAEYKRAKVLQRIGDWQWDRRQVNADRIAELLIDPCRATAWWLAKSEPGDLGKAEGIAEMFTRVAGRLTGEAEPLPPPLPPPPPPPPPADDSVGDVLEGLWEVLDPADRAGLSHMLAGYAERAGRQDLIEELKPFT